MAQVEVFLARSPGESRGIIARNGLYHHLIIHRDCDRPCDRLGARLIGRVSRVDPALRGAFVDMGMGEPFGFLPGVSKGQVAEGHKIEVEVSAEPREDKGPLLKLIGPGLGEARLLTAGPDIEDVLARLAPGVSAQSGIAALRASIEAEEDALVRRFTEPSVGLDLSIERTRALIAVDLDFSPAPGRDGRKARDQANWSGLVHTARLLGLKSWGGLVVIDLIGAGLHGETVLKAVRTAFAREPDAAYGPLSRFGLMQLSLPWSRRPIDDRLLDGRGCPTLQTRGQRLVQALQLELLIDPASPYLTLRANPEDARIVAGAMKALGPRARVEVDPALSPGQFSIKEA